MLSIIDNNKKTNPRKAAAARLNGARSRGPVTPEGKAIASQNARTHGHASTLLVLSNEDQPAFQALLDAYLARFQPADPVERDLVFELASVRWRQRRLWSDETALRDHTMDAMAPELASTYTRIDEPTRSALAFKHLADNGTSLEMIRRYDTHYRRAYDRTLANLQQLQSPPAAILQNEPTESIPLSPGNNLQRSDDLTGD